MKDLFAKLLVLAQKRIKYFVSSKDAWYQGSKWFWEEIQKELQEAQDEYEAGNSVCLEDELGDVLRDYLCLLYSLEAEGKIQNTKNVLARAYDKFSQRVDSKTWADKGDWKQIKQKQKQKLQDECYGN